jgi:hypothetical protein
MLTRMEADREPVMPRDLTGDIRTSFARALRRACRLTRRYVSGEHLMIMFVSAVSAVRPGPGRPARAVLYKYGATMQDVAEEIARRAWLVLLQRAHPDIFEDALRAVISKAKQREGHD